MKSFIKIILLAVALAILFFVFFSLAEIVPFLDRQSAPVCIKGNCFYAELARTPAERERGLMFRTKLGENEGMLFVFDKEAVYPFWMRNTLIPLDMIWIGKDKKITFLKDSAQPCPEQSSCQNITPDAQALYVLEINGGLSNRFGFEVGDEAEIISQ